MNKVILVGYVGRDADYYDNYGGVCIFSVATSQHYKDDDGEWKQNTDWHRCKVFGSYSKSIADKLKKGCLVSVEGMLKTKKQEKAGTTIYETFVSVSSVRVLSKQNSEQGETKQKSQQNNTGETEDETPF